MTSRKNRTRGWLNFWGLIFFVVVIFFNAQSAGAESSFGSMSGYLDDIAGQAPVSLGKVSLPVMIGNIIYGVLAFLGVISLLLVIYAGLKWMMADGNEETVSQAKKVIWYAIIGILIVMGSYAITFYVVDRIVSSTLQSNMSNIPIGPENLGPSGGIRGSGEGFIECLGDGDCAGRCSATQTDFCDSGTCRCKNNYCDNGACLQSCRDQGYTSGYCDSGNLCQCT